MKASNEIAAVCLIRVWLKFCRGPSTPWPAHQTTVCKKKPATPAGMTENSKSEEWPASEGEPYLSDPNFIQGQRREQSSKKYTGSKT
jgi:hypothetical protein